MASLTDLPALLERAAAHLKASRAPRDETFEELCYGIELTLAALYRFQAEASARELLNGPLEEPCRTTPTLVLVSSREPSRRAPSAKSRA